jgi:beta-glucosidase
MSRSFPDGFRWGTATAAHQIEGGNWNNDWWRWEHTEGSGCAEPSGDACDSLHLWPADVDLVARLGLDNYRFSVEWSRIEPEDGEWSQATLDHYRRQCEALLAAGVDPVVTLHHFTTPRWLADRGGWNHDDTPARFGAFAERVATELGPVTRRFCTINEPNIVATMGYLLGIFPPGQQDGAARHKANDLFCQAHRLAVDAVRASAPGVPVGITLSLTDYQAIEGGEARLERMRRDMDDVFLDVVDGDDFVGVQTYSRMLIGPDGWVGPAEGMEVLPMGYEYYPESLAGTLRYVWQYTKGQVPLLVTENGIGTDDDEQRVRYVTSALEGVLDCIADGIDVRGYTYWSLLDNFEWAFGYRPKFGLVGVDRTTFARTPKPSAEWFGSVARANALA